MLGGLLSVHLSSGCLLSSPIRSDPLVVETWAIWEFNYLLRGECATIIFKTNTFKHRDAAGYRSWVVASSAVKGKESRLSDWSLHPWPDTPMNLLRLHSWVVYSGMFWKGGFYLRGKKKSQIKSNSCCPPFSTESTVHSCTQVQTEKTLLQPNRKPGQTRDCMTPSTQS